MDERTVAATDTEDRPRRGQPPVRPETSVVTVDVEGTEVGFDVVLDGKGPTYFSLGVRKSGSTMLHKMIAFMAARNGVNLVDLPGTFFRKGLVVNKWADIDLSHVLRPGNIYAGFRAFPPTLGSNPRFRNALKVFMFRDPRDALVSQYFSDAYSHSLPSETEAVGPGRELFLKKREAALNSEIDDYVLRHARALGNTLDGYRPLLDDPKCLVLRYEEYVFQKRRLVHKVLKHFGWTMAPGQIDALMDLVDIVPGSEDKQRFLRKAVPGDHREKLKPETIRRLNNVLKDAMATFDYY